jgi:phenylacetate-coenzyme A ligase PaaK-like adenylate-forming protein
LIPGKNIGGVIIKHNRKISVKGDFFKKYFLGSDDKDLSPKDIKSIQRNRLEKIIRHAISQSDFYRELYLDKEFA